MRIATWNVNGLRAAIRKGLDDFVRNIDVDIWMLQEIRSYPEQLPKRWSPPNKMNVLWHPAERKGYSGVATWSCFEMRELERGMGTTKDPSDREGRILATEHTGFTCINTYLPSGSSKEERQLYKENWMDEWQKWLQPYLNDKNPVIIGGDFNIAHEEIDLWNASSNRRNSGFLPQERSWFSELLKSGWYDLCRESWGAVQGPYSWWSNRGRARIENRGWRLDYILGNEAASRAFHSAEIVREGGLSISDHAPVVVEFDL